MTKAKDDPKFKGQVDKLTTDLSDLKAYGDYVNPFAVYLDALYFTYQPADASDLEHAHKSLERCLSFAAQNDYLKQDLAALDSLIAGQPVAATTYIFLKPVARPAASKRPWKFRSTPVAACPSPPPPSRNWCCNAITPPASPSRPPARTPHRARRQHGLGHRTGFQK